MDLLELYIKVYITVTLFTVVAKQLRGESQEEEDCFIKEARLMITVDHENVVKFKASSTTPLAIMMEYLYFDFSLFDVSKSLSNWLNSSIILTKLTHSATLATTWFRRWGTKSQKDWNICTCTAIT